ncbi:hypothetical protein MA16_Dca018842 [Dendrobium catenatum]|uniref:Uncharacterized protein n=1 Tax=Dendrobium catenatum TaxID=906689 RepID=A0A2I0WS31_9ASPA|nr:hypothetical protein MA16_Dca018842 [Dendrobium catenatum]
MLGSIADPLLYSDHPQAYTQKASAPLEIPKHSISLSHTQEELCSLHSSPLLVRPPSRHVRENTHLRFFWPQARKRGHEQFRLLDSRLISNSNEGRLLLSTSFDPYILAIPAMKVGGGNLALIPC